MKFIYPEAKLAQDRGIPRFDLVKLRRERLERGKDWVNRPKQGGVLWTEEALKILSGDGRRHDTVAPVSDPPPAHKFVVTRIPINPRIVLAKSEAGEETRVWVGKNQMFVVGDEIEGEPMEPGLFRFVGKLPRDKRRARLRP